VKRTSPGLPADFDEDDDAVLETLGLRRTEVGRRAGCPPVEEIQAAGADALPEPHRLEVELHLESCAVCAMLAADLREWDGAELSTDARERIGKALATTASRARRWRTPAWGLAAAAAVVAAVLVPAALREGRVGPSPTPAPPSPPALVLPLEPLAVRSGPGLHVRGGDGYDEALAAALAPYVAGEHEQAVGRLSALAARYPDAASARLYLGVALLLRDRAEEAVVALEAAHVRAGAFWGPHAAWYLAVARERTGRRDEARAALDELCRGDSEYRARACAAAASLAPPGR
jgi:tetratricopeptide (TPR) repeat protein